MSARIMIAGTGSGCGKTSVVCGILGAFLSKEKKLVSFKSGPDYIDPIFHQTVLGIPSYNLDVFLCGEEGVKNLLKTRSAKNDLAVIEGVMGFYDGISGDSFKSSSYEISQITNTPVILVINCKGKGVSVAAEINGYLEFAPNNIAGVILNNVSPKMEEYYRHIVEKHCSTKIFGYFPNLPEGKLEERKLGLFLGDKKDYETRLGALCAAALKSIDLEGILELGKKSPEIESKPQAALPPTKTRIGIIKDRAFAFHYWADIEILQKLGGEIQFFSLMEGKIPPNLDGLIIGGGYISDNAEKISKNQALLAQLKSLVRGGLPTVAMGGGVGVLAKSLDGYLMAGLLNIKLKTGKNLSNFGYHTLTAKEENLLCKKGESFPAHEFHCFESSDQGNSFVAQRPNGRKARECGFSTKILYAGLPYLTFCGNENLAENFLSACVKYKKAKINGI